MSGGRESAPVVTAVHIYHSLCVYWYTNVPHTSSDKKKVFILKEDQVKCQKKREYIPVIS